MSQGMRKNVYAVRMQVLLVARKEIIGEWMGCSVK